VQRLQSSVIGIYRSAPFLVLSLGTVNAMYYYIFLVLAYVITDQTDHLRMRSRIWQNLLWKPSLCWRTAHLPDT